MKEGICDTPAVRVDYSFEDRQAFLDGCDGHEVDLSVYDTMLEDNNG
jgi:hypothetical protein